MEEVSRRRPTTGAGVCVAAAAALLAAACAGPAAQTVGPPAVPVEAVTLQARPIEQASEFVGTVKSRLARAHLALENVVRTRFPQLDLGAAAPDSGGGVGRPSQTKCARAVLRAARSCATP